ATQKALAKAAADHGPARIVVNCAGIGPAKRIVGRDGPMPLPDFARVIEINLIGTFNVMRLAAAAMQGVEPLQDGERGVILCTARCAAEGGKFGRSVWAASRPGVGGLFWPAPRNFPRLGTRLNGTAREFSTPPMLLARPEAAQQTPPPAVPFPKLLGKPP